MSNITNEIKIDLLQKNMKIIQRNDFFNFSIESLLISEFIKINKNAKNIIDLGTGNGAIPLFLSKKTNIRIYGIEIQKISYELAKKNIEINNLKNQITIINDDIKNSPNHFKKGSMDIVISNPPFFKFHENSSIINEKDSLTFARHEVLITLDEIVKIASFLLKDKSGYFYLVHRASRLDEILESFKKYNIAAKKIKFCYTTRNKNARIVLIEGLKNGNNNLEILPPLVINNSDGSYTDEILKMFK